MADEVVLGAATTAALQNLQNLQAAGAVGLAQAVRSEQSIAELLEETRRQLGTTTPTRGNIVNIVV